ncbi:hypothetical protein LTR74_016904 [Friedmanniomyces endolithicus]|nr:hypothetical protein LTR74_016904 [Friedmanniomyces endolithicus]
MAAPRLASQQYTGYVHVLGCLQRGLFSHNDGEAMDKQAVLVLSGMGGVGKSETVLHFLEMQDRALRQRLWAVFGVDCGTALNGFKIISNRSGWPLDEADFLYGAKGHLASCSRPLLLVQVMEILTTRLSDARRYASPDPQDSKRKLFVRMEGLNHDAAANLLLEASEVQDRGEQTSKEARDLVTALKGRFAQKKLLDTEIEQARYRKVSVTFEGSAQHLTQLTSTDPPAEDALALPNILAFVHYRGVSEDIFARAWQHEGELIATYGDVGDENDHDIEHLSLWHVTQCWDFLPF